MSNRDRILQRSAEIENPLMFSPGAQEAELGQDSRKTSVRNNFFVIWVLMSIIVLLLVGRVFFLQVIKGNYFREIAENNRIRSIVIKAPRGIIKDKFGQVLARNIPSFDAIYVPDDLPKDEQQRKELYGKLAQIIGMAKADVEGLMESSDMDAREAFLLKENIGYEAALILEENSGNLKGVYIDKTARRDYHDSMIFSSIIGYDGKITREELLANPDYLMTDYIGKNGLEYTYEKQLHGKHGEHRVEVDSNGQIKEDLGVFNPLPGDELVLSIDAELQRKIHEVLSRVMQENQEATGAAVVAINPQNGGVLALVNEPGYDNNLFARGIKGDEYARLLEDDKRPMLNRSISGEYPPGSTFKPLVASAALEEQVINEQTTIGCGGAIHVGSWSFPDWKTHGTTDVKKAIAESCDVFFYAVGGSWENINGLGMDTMAKYARLFGLGDTLGIDLPSESKGNIPDESWKFKKFGEKWYVGDNYHAAIGQGYITVTPLQLASYISVIANGGTLYKPHVVDRIIHAETKQEEPVQPEVIRRNFISAGNIRIVQEGMRQTVTDGSGVQLKTLDVISAGKTGTAQFGPDKDLHSWYISYAPYEKPEIAMIVLIEGGGEGHSWAVPVTREIYQWYFDLDRGVKPLPEDEQKKPIPSTVAGE